MKHKLSPIFLYLAFFIVNLINANIFLSGILNPNLPGFNRSFLDIFLSTLGDTGILMIFFAMSFFFFSNIKKRAIFLLIVTLLLTILGIGLASFANIFALGFSFVQLDSFQNPSQIEFVLYYARYALSFLFKAPQNLYLFPFLGFIMVFLFTDKSGYIKPLLKTKLVSFLLGLIFVVLPIFTYPSQTLDTVFEHTANPIHAGGKMGLYRYYIEDLVTYLVPNKDYVATSEDLIELQSFMTLKESDCHINLLDDTTYCRENEYTGIAQGKNLILVQLEAINNFVIGLTIDGIEITPNLNRLAENGKYFDQFYSSSGIGNTSDAEFSAMTGLYGNGNELTMYTYDGSNYPSLAKLFREENYDTFSLHGNVGDFYKRNINHIETLGFDTHYDLDSFTGDLIHSWLNDKSFLIQSVEIMKTYDGPFFSFPLTVTSHAPYVPSPQVPCDLDRFNSLTNMAKNYIEHVMYVDEAIGLFLDKLETEGLLENSILAFYGDHTSSLFKGDLESALNTTVTDIFYRKEMQKVPFILYNESIFTPEMISKVRSTVDMSATFANLFGLNEGVRFGVDALSQEPTFVYSPRSLDVIFDNGFLEYPRNRLYNATNGFTLEQAVHLFEQQKRINDLILKTKYFVS